MVLVKKTAVVLTPKSEANRFEYDPGYQVVCYHRPGFGFDIRIKDFTEAG